MCRSARLDVAYQFINIVQSGSYGSPCVDCRPWNPRSSRATQILSITDVPPMFMAAIPVLAVIETSSSFLPLCFLRRAAMIALSRSDFPVPTRRDERAIRREYLHGLACSACEKHAFAFVHDRAQHANLLLVQRDVFMHDRPVGLQARRRGLRGEERVERFARLLRGLRLAVLDISCGLAFSRGRRRVGRRRITRHDVLVVEGEDEQGGRSGHRRVLLIDA